MRSTRASNLFFMVAIINLVVSIHTYPIILVGIFHILAMATLPRQTLFQESTMSECRTIGDGFRVTYVRQVRSTHEVWLIYPLGPPPTSIYSTKSPTQ